MGLVEPGGGEERPPVLSRAVEVMEPVADVGHHAVDVDDGQWTAVGIGHWPLVAFRPTSDATSSDRKASRAGVAGSSWTAMPTSAVPTAPTPTHTP